MKKILFSILFLFILGFLHAEKKVSEYYSSYFDKTYEIQVSEVRNGKFSFYIYCEPVDHHTIGFALESKDVPDFVASLNEIGKKFIEWSNTAKENNVSDFDKDFNVKFKSVNVFFTYGKDWHFSFSVKMKPYFKVTSKQEHLIVFRSGNLTASDNRYMEVDGFYLVFKSINEINDFIQALDIDTILKENNKRSDIDNLFN